MGVSRWTERTRHERDVAERRSLRAVAGRAARALAALRAARIGRGDRGADESGGDAAHCRNDASDESRERDGAAADRRSARGGAMTTKAFEPRVATFVCI